MTEQNDVKVEPVKDEAKEKLDAAEKARAELETRFRETERKLDTLGGQLSVLTNAVNEPVEPNKEEPQLDLIADPDKALDYHFNKRAAPLLRQNTELQAANQKEIISLKRAEDWKKYGVEVETLAGRIPASTLATPGAYENLLNIVKAQKIDQIVKEQVAAEVAKFQSDAAKAAAASASTQATTAAPRPSVESPMSDEEKHIAKKLGVAEKDWMAIEKDVVFDGVRYRGPVAH